MKQSTERLLIDSTSSFSIAQVFVASAFIQAPCLPAGTTKQIAGLSSHELEGEEKEAGG